MSRSAPGLSAVPANSEPSMTRVCTGDQCLADVAGVLEFAVADHRDPGLARHLRGEVDRRDLGDAHTRTTCVVQMEPGSTPTLMASAPASMSAWSPRSVATLPPMIWTSRNAGLDLSVRIISVTSRA